MLVISGDVIVALKIRVGDVIVVPNFLNAEISSSTGLLKSSTVCTKWFGDLLKVDIAFSEKLVLVIEDFDDWLSLSRTTGFTNLSKVSKNSTPLLGNKSGLPRL